MKTASASLLEDAAHALFADANDSLDKMARAPYFIE